MKDPDLEAFVVAIERHLSARRGRSHTLSPPDFALAREWHGASVPLAAVLAGIDRAFERENDVASLRFCRRFVEALAGDAAPARRPAGDEPRTPSEDLHARLLELRDALVGAARPAVFERPERCLAELIDLAAVAREPNWAYLRGKLEELDRLVEESALLALEPAEAAALRAEAEQAARRQQGHVAEAALAEARGRYLRRRARERFRLPRVGGG